MNWLEKWFLKRLCRKLVLQGPNHDSRIEDYYRVMYDAARREFREDNDPTLNAFLKACHQKDMSQRQWGTLACPFCYESDMDKLVWIGVNVRCANCGKIYTP